MAVPAVRVFEDLAYPSRQPVYSCLPGSSDCRHTRLPSMPPYLSPLLRRQYYSCNKGFLKGMSSTSQAISTHSPASDVNSEPVFTTSPPSPSLVSAVTSSLGTNGGKWILSPDGRALERVFKFGKFKEAWVNSYISSTSTPIVFLLKYNVCTS